MVDEYKRLARIAHSMLGTDSKKKRGSKGAVAKAGSSAPQCYSRCVSEHISVCALYPEERAA